MVSIAIVFNQKPFLGEHFGNVFLRCRITRNPLLLGEGKGEVFFYGSMLKEYTQISGARPHLKKAYKKSQIVGRRPPKADGYRKQSFLYNHNVGEGKSLHVDFTHRTRFAVMTLTHFPWIVPKRSVLLITLELRP